MPEKRVWISFSSVGFLLVIWLLVCVQYKFAFHQALYFFNFRSVTADVTGSNQTFPYVAFHGAMNDGRRIGNQLFSLAAVIFVAELTNRKAVIPTGIRLTTEDIFQFNLEHISNPCPCQTIGERKHLEYDLNTEKLNLSDPKIANQTILVWGYRQSWKYTLTIERRLRRHLVFKEEIQQFAESFLRENVPHGWPRVGFVRVGIHARRRDSLSPHFINYGYTSPNESYFLKAMKYFTDRYSRVQFIVASDDYGWCKKHITSDSNSSDTVNVTYSYHHRPGQDLALLSMCNHVIMSTGTFGWWAAWLAMGTTIYYGNWPRSGTTLSRHFTQGDFFPPYWIPMTN